MNTTRKRIDSHSTEFGLWIRKQDKVASSRGYAATDLDYIWTNYKTGDWMLIEEKRYMSKVRWSQGEIFKTINKACKNDPKYKGFHLLQFEKTSPEDGKTYFDKQEVTAEELIEILMYKK